MALGAARGKVWRTEPARRPWCRRRMAVCQISQTMATSAVTAVRIWMAICRRLLERYTASETGSRLESVHVVPLACTSMTRRAARSKSAEGR